MKKGIAAVILTVILLVSLPVAVMAAEGEELKCEVYVTIVNGKPMLSLKKTAVTDTDGDGKLTLSDALYCAHQAYFIGGAAAGYSAEVSPYGLSLTKLWGVENNGAYGYYLNHVSPQSLLDEIKDNDVVAAFIYADTVSWTDSYCFFDKNTLDIKSGEEITLTLSAYSGFDPVAKPAEGVNITVNGAATEYTTDKDGKVTLKITESGAVTVSASKEGLNLVPPVCIVNAEEVKLDPPPVTNNNEEPQSYAWLIPVCAAVIVSATAVAVAISNKNKKKDHENK